MEHRVTLPTGEIVPALGQGTWRMGERRDRREGEIAALRLGIELGMTLIDTAEMYGEGRTETLAGEAIQGLRDEVFLVSKVYPHNASRTGMRDACERSLRRLGTDRLDLYLLHWRGGIPLGETVEGFEALRRAGKIRHWGVSNLNTDEMEELARLPDGAACATNQILYNVTRRGAEWELIPWLSERRIPVMAYSPIEQGSLPHSRALASVADRYGATLVQVALAWVLRREGVIAIPKAANPEHVRENRKALDLTFDETDLQAIDEEFPPPTRQTPLEMA